MKSNFKVGQTVYCAMFGEGKVVEIHTPESTDDIFTVGVKFKNMNSARWYTNEGKYYEEVNRTLFFTKPEVQGATEPVFEPQLKEGDKIVTLYNGICSIQTVKEETEKSVYVYPTEEDPEEGSYFPKNDVQFFKLGEEIKF